MIDVHSLTRYYGKTAAVEQVSFTIDQRAIVGLLGHNGAGKTTVMKMLSGYLEPSSGSVHVGGRDLEKHRRDIQRSLGYLPENLPVYPEMSIADYLDYAAHLKGLRGAQKSRAIRASVEATELGARYFDPIGQLSRGFKQRVGVAQAILGKPDLLILDEPGNGLDPQQNEHMRELIRELARHATVMLSTHIMQEVDALCDRVLVLSNGRLALDSPLARLRESRHLLLSISEGSSPPEDYLMHLPQISRVERQAADGGKLLLRLSLHEGTALDTAAANISRSVIESGAKLYRLAPEERDLEQIFRELCTPQELNMQRDGVLGRVARKELQLFFASPVAWLFLAGFMVVCLFTFFWVEAFFARNIADVRPLFEWMPLLLIFLCAALTMRSWSEERRSGTLEHVLTLPVALWQFVLGKFLACAGVLALALLATLSLPLTVASIASLDWGPVLAAYLAAFLLGCSYLSVGLFVSSRTDNAIVSLLGSVTVCGLIYLVGSEVFVGFFGGATADTLRLLGSGARFESITRGVIDLGDLYYYVALSAAFLLLNVYALERGRWAKQTTPRHRSWQLLTLLLLANLLLPAFWLQKAPGLRVDVTQGELYSLSEPSRALLEQLEEPLLIRGYFSERSHPLLAPLVPQLRDLLREYAVASRGRVRVEFVDPAEDPAAEQEANQDYGIQANPFQVADRYQSALVNAYFDVLVKYGGEFETLGFSDFIEVKTSTNGQPEVVLRNPEYDVTRAMRDVLYRYRSGGQLFDQIKSPVSLRAYVSSDSLLPQVLIDYRAAVRSEAESVAAQAKGKFSFEFIEPEAGDGSTAARIVDEWGFKPMITALGDEQEFYFYVTLEDDHQVIQVPTGRFEGAEFADALEAGLRRFASGFTRSVALALPQRGPTMRGMPPQGHSFATLQQSVSRDHTITIEDLSDGSVDPSADLLLVVAPENLDEQARFALDQYLMRGGTVVLATAPWSIDTQGAELVLRPINSGLQDWLEHHGIGIENTVVLDERQAAFPVPVVRQLAGYEFRDMQLVDYPYLLDIRDDGLNDEHPITSSLPQVTVGWASPIRLDDNSRQSTVLMRSSPDSWRSQETNVMPRIDAQGQFSLPGTVAQRQTADIAVLVQGVFTSFFDELPKSEDAAASEDTGTDPTPSAALLGKSPDSARLLVVASNDFVSDQVLSGVIAAAGTQYFGPVELLINAIDWALQDSSLVSIRSRAHFNRTLPPLDRGEQARIEYFNYAAALLSLLLLYGLWRLLRRRRAGKLAEVMA